MHNGFYKEKDEIAKQNEEVSWEFLETLDIGIDCKDMSLYLFLHGFCDCFAWSLKELYQYPTEAIYDSNGYLVHAYCYHDIGPKRFFIDVRGYTDNWKEFIDEFEDFIETSEYSALDRRKLALIPMLKDVALEIEIAKKYANWICISSFLLKHKKERRKNMEKINLERLEGLSYEEADEILDKEGYYFLEAEPDEPCGISETAERYYYSSKDDEDLISCVLFLDEEDDPESEEDWKVKTIKWFRNNPKKISISRECPMCGEEHVMRVEDDPKIEQLKKYMTYGKQCGVIQDALSLFTKWEREFYKTGYCFGCQRKIFGHPTEAELKEKDD